MDSIGCVFGLSTRVNPSQLVEEVKAHQGAGQAGQTAPAPVPPRLCRALPDQRRGCLHPAKDPGPRVFGEDPQVHVSRFGRRERKAPPLQPDGKLDFRQEHRGRKPGSYQNGKEQNQGRSPWARLTGYQIG